MARINFDDDVESRDEWHYLVELLNGDHDKARGMLIRFWRRAQKCFAEDRLVPSEDMELGRFQPLIQSRWAIKTPEGFRAIGSDDHFGWYKQKVDAGKKGGRPRKPAESEGAIPETETKPAESGCLIPETGRPFSETGSNRMLFSVNPPAPALSPAPVPSQKTENTKIGQVQDEDKDEALAADTERCIAAWDLTLRHFGIRRAITPSERAEIVRSIQRNGGGSLVLQAIIGARYEPKRDGYDPGDYLSVTRVLGTGEKGKFNWFVSLGAKAEKKRVLEEHRPDPTEALPDDYVPPPAEVRQVLRAAIGSIRGVSEVREGA